MLGLSMPHCASQRMETDQLAQLKASKARELSQHRAQGRVSSSKLAQVPAVAVLLTRSLTQVSAAGTGCCGVACGYR